MTKANRKLQHNISVSHQILNTEIRVIEKLLPLNKLTEDDIVEHIKQLKTAVAISKSCLAEHYSETNKTDTTSPMGSK